MPTIFSNTLHPDSTNDTNFRAWAQFIEDTFITTGGWVVTTDTGQTLPSALVHPPSQSTKCGYRIYRMNDTLQATNPVFLRIDYGAGGGPPPLPPAIWVSVGTGSDGSGNLTGVVLNSQDLERGQPGYAATAIGNSYGSAFHGRCTFCLFTQSNPAYPFFFGIERSKDSLGNDTGDGVLMIFPQLGGNQTLIKYSKYCVLAGGTQPTIEEGVTFIMTSRNPADLFPPGDLGLGILIHFKGVAQQPGINWLFCNINDIPAQGSLATQLYGRLRTYQHLDAGVQVYRAYAGTVGAIDTNVRMLMRYD